MLEHEKTKALGNQTINPFTEEKIQFYPYESAQEIELKCKKSHETFLNWSQLTIKERSVPVNKFMELLKDHKEELAKLIVLEMGKPFAQAKQEIDFCTAIVKYCLENAEEILQDEEIKFSSGHAIVSYCPQGVILSIQPWNFPFYQVIRYAVPNLLAGNTTLLRHASNVWGCALKIEELFIQAGLPTGAFTVLQSKKEDLDLLYKAKEIRGVTFTGSAEAGKIIAKKAAENLKKSVMELGGNDAYIVLKGADLEKTAIACMRGRIINSGQTCTAAKRFIVVESIYEEFKKLFVEKMKEAQMGDPMDKTTKVGPMAKLDLMEKLKEQVEESLDKGAICLIGGNVEKRKGFYFQPTILENLSPGMPAYDDELFGPVASLIKVKDLEEAIKVANSSDFGLGGGIFGANEKELVEIAKTRLDTGRVSINGYGSNEPQLPFGGVKDSGYGREHSKYGFHEFMNIKTIAIHKN